MTTVTSYGDLPGVAAYYTYATIPEMLRTNGCRHLLNARAYARDANLEYAWGSLAKAARNYRWRALMRSTDDRL